MAKYLVVASYTAEGIKGVVSKGGSARRDAVGKMIADAGGTMEAFYFGFGKTDAYVLCDVPDAASIVALSMAVNASGMVTGRAVPLITSEEIDAAAKKTVKYRVPGA